MKPNAMLNPVRLQVGSANAYLIPAEEGDFALVDAGLSAGALRRALARRGVAPAQIRLIVVTHAHFDHVGGLAWAQAASGAPVLTHPLEADLLARGAVIIPRGANAYGRMIHRLGTLAARAGVLRFAPATPDHIVEGPFALHDYGLAGELLHTPGHSAGSLTLLCATGDAFVGDLAANHLPWGRGPILPPFFGARAELLASWARLLEAGAKRIHPGHGPAFPAERLRARLAAEQSG